MVKFCSVKGCNFAYQNRSSHVDETSLHVFPTEPCLREAWAKAVGRQAWVPKKNSVICSKHFRPEDLDLSGKFRRLKKGAVPYIFAAVSNCGQQAPAPGQKSGEDWLVLPKQQLYTGQETLPKVGAKLHQEAGGPRIRVRSIEEELGRPTLVKREPPEEVNGPGGVAEKEEPPGWNDDESASGRGPFDSEFVGTGVGGTDPPAFGSDPLAEKSIRSKVKFDPEDTEPSWAAGKKRHYDDGGSTQRNGIRADAPHGAHTTCSQSPHGTCTCATVGAYLAQHGERHECAECGKTFATQYHLKYHVTYLCAPPTPLECAQCGTGCAGRHRLEQHVRLECTGERTHSQGGEQRPPRARPRGLSYQTLNAYIRLQAGRAVGHRCARCAKTFTSKSDLNHHAKHKCTLQEAPQPLQCETCRKTFTTKIRLYFHMKQSCGSKTGLAA